MKTESEFLNFYRVSLTPQLMKHDSDFRVAMKHAVKIGLIFFTATMCVAFLFLFFSDAFRDFGVVAIFILILISLIVSVVHFKLNFSSDTYKNIAIKPMIEFISNQNLRYFPEGCIDREFVKSLKILPNFNCYSGEDLITGKIGATEIAYSEVKVVNERIVKTKNGLKKVRDEIFKGEIFLADFNKHFQNKTILKPDLSIFNFLNIPNVGSRVKLEDVNFEKMFEVYSTNQVEARYILTPDFMERLTLLSKSNRKISAVFQDDDMILLMPSSVNRFESPGIATWENEKHAMRIFNDVVRLFNLVEGLNLNTRIWTKE